MGTISTVEIQNQKQLQGQTVNDSKRVQSSQITAQLTFKLIIVYHGTTKSAARSIQISREIKPSSDGRLGGGIYFTNNKDVAQKIGRHRSWQKGEFGYAIVSCLAIGFFIESEHPKWRNNTTRSLISDKFDEYCFKYGSLQIKNVNYS